MRDKFVIRGDERGKGVGVEPKSPGVRSVPKLQGSQKPAPLKPRQVKPILDPEFPPNCSQLHKWLNYAIREDRMTILTCWIAIKTKIMAQDWEESV